MKYRMNVLCMAASVVAMPFLLAGCEREVSHSTSTSTKSDGSSKSTEKVVTKAKDGTTTTEEVKTKVSSEGAVKSEESTKVKAPDGTVIKEETTKTTSPAAP